MSKQLQEECGRQLTLTAKIAVMFSFFSPLFLQTVFQVTFFVSVAATLGSLFGAGERQLLSILKIQSGGNFNFWYNSVKFTKTSVESVLASADIYKAVSTCSPHSVIRYQVGGCL
jgi:hypothetical protein